jgi:hypothetical protein
MDARLELQPPAISDARTMPAYFSSDASSVVEMSTRHGT